MYSLTSLKAKILPRLILALDNSGGSGKVYHVGGGNGSRLINRNDSHECF